MIRLDRPPANAIELAGGRGAPAGDPRSRRRSGVGAIVVWGGPKIFAAGADVKAMATWGPEEVRPSVDALGDACDLLEAIGTVSIAAVNGYALGGGHGARARLRPPVPRRRRDVGPARDQARRDPRRRRHAAPRAARSGPAGRGSSCTRAARSPPPRPSSSGSPSGSLAPDEVLADRARGRPGVRSRPPPGARRRQGRDRGRRRKRPERRGSQAERAAFLALFGTPDQREGMAAFLEKRPPRFGAEPRRSPGRNIHGHIRVTPRRYRAIRGMHAPESDRPDRE